MNQEFLDETDLRLLNTLQHNANISNAIAPGLTLVEATEYVPQARHDYYQQGRAIARAQVPDDVTSTVLFLLSHGSGYVTGQVLPVNGGFVMH